MQVSVTFIWAGVSIRIQIFNEVCAQSLSANCDPELPASYIVLTWDTAFCHDNYLCQTVLKSHNARQSYGPYRNMCHYSLCTKFTCTVRPFFFSFLPSKKQTTKFSSATLKKNFIQAIIFRIQILEGKHCRSRWGGSWWATSWRSTLFANLAIFVCRA